MRGGRGPPHPIFYNLNLNNLNKLNNIINIIIIIIIIIMMMMMIIIQNLFFGGFIRGVYNPPLGGVITPLGGGYNPP